jgi:glutathione S-transferase
MFLIGQYDSPFVRRVAIALRLYGIKFEHKPWSTFGDADKIAPYNPLRRVPTLVLAPHGIERRRHLKVCALATGLADKSVSLVYESVLRKEQLKLWVDRCEAQILGALDVLEKDRAAVATPYWFGERIGHADIAVACMLRFTSEAHSHLFNAERYPALWAHSAACEALAPFKEIAQPLMPPGR